MCTVRDAVVASLLVLVPFRSALAQDWRQDRSCAEALGPARFRHVALPEEGVERRGHRRCLPLAGGGTLCELADDTSFTYVLERAPYPRLVVASRPRVTYPLVDVVETALADAGDGGLVLALRDAVSNGMGVAYWTVFAMQPGPAGWRVDSLATEDYRARGSWVLVRGEARCSFLETHWDPDSEPGRGEGLYLGARWHRLDGGRFAVRGDRPLLRRRYLFSFERERLRGDRAAPLAWLREAVPVPGVRPSRNGCMLKRG